jgi:hypothetical protein
MAILIVPKKAARVLREFGASNIAERYEPLLKELASTRQSRDGYQSKYRDASAKLTWAEDHYRKLLREKVGLIARIKELEQQLALRNRSVQLLLPRGKARENILAGLRGMGSEHPGLRALLAIVENASHHERNNVTLPNISNDARNINAGRMGGIEDVQNMIEQLVLKAQVPSEKDE